MKPRLIILLSLAFLAAGCGGQTGDSTPKFFDQSETPAAAAPEPPEFEYELPEDGQPQADGAAEAAPAPEQAGFRNRDIDPANTEALESERVICEEKGGRWSRAGTSGGFACVFNTRDANKQCKAASQCEGYCLARSGTCAPLKPLFGCHEIKTDSGRTQTVCVN